MTGITFGERSDPLAVGRARSMLQDAAFLRLWTGTTASGLATWALPFVLGLGVIHGELSAKVLGILLAARTAGFIIAVPVGGLLSDRVSTVQVIRVSGLAAASASPVLALAMEHHLLVAVLAAAVMGAGQGACRPAFQAHVPQVVDAVRRQRANALITIAVRGTTLLGPACAALLARTVSVRGLILIVGALWLVSAMSPCRGEPVAVPEQNRSHMLRDMGDGFAEAWRHRWFAAGLAALVPIIAFGYSATNIELPVVSREHYGGDSVFTFAMMAYTIGALIGAFVLTRWRPHNEGWVSLFGIWLYCLAPLVLFLRPPAGVIIATYAIIGIGMELFNVPWFTATQREVARGKLARVSSVDFLVSYGLAPLGLAIYPLAIDCFGSGPVLIVTTFLCASTPILAALAPGARRFSDPRASA